MARPSFKITKAVCRKVETLGKQGLNKKQIAECLGVCYNTLHEKTKEFKEFYDSVERGQALGISLATKALLAQVKLGNISAIKYYLNNRAQEWTESREINVNDAREHSTVQEVGDRVSEMLGKGNEGPAEGVTTH